MNGRRLAVLLVAVVALAAAGCGGDSSDEAGSDTDTVVVETTTEDTTTDDMTTTEEDESSDVDTSGLTENCAELAGLGSRLASAVGGQNADVGDVSRLFDELADRVPDEIKDDWQVLARNFEKVAEALEGVDLASGETPSAEVLAKLQELSATFDSTEMQEAAGNIEEWARENC
jgi:hypothetical protein